MPVTIAQQIILHLIKHPPLTAEDINLAKRLVLRAEKNQSSIPTSANLIKAYHDLRKKNKIKDNPTLLKLLTKRSVRTLSGVAIITVLTKPYPCPGNCIYCPNEKGMPKSYISDEPAAARALTLKFDPFEQVAQRIKMLETNGHPTDKLELIVKGGTWNAYPLDYQYWFITECFRAANNMKTLKQENIKTNIDKIKKQLAQSQTKNETAKHRIIGLTLETRPDFINETTIAQMREMGCTRIEMGAQTIDDKILKTIKRGHDAEEIIRATKLLKNYGFKVDYHLMPQLPGSTPNKDLKMLREIFDNPNYRPDMIKIYPCTVINNSELYEWVKQKKYKPYTTKSLIKILKEFKTTVPRYVRISRLIRDIPGHHVKAGNTMTNLRQVIQKEMAEEGLKCKCLRCREIGHHPRQLSLPSLGKRGRPYPPLPERGLGGSGSKPRLFVERYTASDGVEYFLSFEDKKRECVFAFCRLRLLSLRGAKRRGNLMANLSLRGAERRGNLMANLSLRGAERRGNPLAFKTNLISSLNKGIATLLPVARDDKTYPAFIRELHTYGQLASLKHENIKTLKQTNIETKKQNEVQHTGLGKQLVAEVEKICKKNKINKLAVISGIGVRDYYRHLGYKLENGYMVKLLR